LIPNCKTFATNKASILHQAAEHIKHLNAQNQEIIEANKKLQEANQQLMTELTDLHRALLGQYYPNNMSQNIPLQHNVQPISYISPLSFTNL